MSKQKTANKILAENPTENAVYITQDGQAFISRNKANNHSQSRKFDKDPEVFFREGFEPQDETELEATLENAVTENESLKTVVERVVRATDLSEDVEEIDGDTPEAVVKVLQLREELATAQERAVKAESELKTRKDDNEKLVEGLEKAINEKSALDNDLKVLRTENETLGKEKIAISKELNALKEVEVKTDQATEPKKPTSKKTK